MSYPAVPDFPPFPGEANVNLMLGGEHYDKTWNDLEDYLRSLGAYVDEQDSALAERITVLESDVANLKRRMSAAETTIADHEQRIKANSDAIASLTSRVAALEPYVSAIKTPVKVAVPTHIGSAGNVTEKQNAAVLAFTRGESVTMRSPALEAIARLIANLMLAAPENDHASVLGHLGTNAEPLTTAAESVRSSAALTSAYEAGPVEEKAPGTDTFLTAGELAHVSDRDGTAGPGVFKNKNGWLYVGTPTA